MHRSVSVSGTSGLAGGGFSTSKPGGSTQETYGGRRAASPSPHARHARNQPAVRTSLPGSLPRGRGGISLPPRRRVRSTRGVASPVRAVYGWSDRFVAAVEMANRKLQATRLAMDWLWDMHKQWLHQWYVRLLSTMALAMGVATAVANLLGVRHVNARMLPRVTETIATALEREVTVQGVRWVAPTGLLGVTPVACLGGVRVGPGEVERTSLSAESLELSLDPLQSLIQRQLIIKLAAHGLDLDLVQQDNFSWFGFPMDTDPSCRDVLPGLHKVLASDGSVMPQPARGEGAQQPAHHPATQSPPTSGGGPAAASPFASITHSAQQHRQQQQQQQAAAWHAAGGGKANDHPHHHHQQQAWDHRDPGAFLEYIGQQLMDGARQQQQQKQKQNSSSRAAAASGGEQTWSVLAEATPPSAHGSRVGAGVANTKMATAASGSGGAAAPSGGAAPTPGPGAGAAAAPGTPGDPKDGKPQKGRAGGGHGPTPNGSNAPSAAATARSAAGNGRGPSSGGSSSTNGGSHALGAGSEAAGGAAGGGGGASRQPSMLDGLRGMSSDSSSKGEVLPSGNPLLPSPSASNGHAANGVAAAHAARGATAAGTPAKPSGNNGGAAAAASQQQQQPAVVEDDRQGSGWVPRFKTARSTARRPGRAGSTRRGSAGRGTSHAVQPGRGTGHVAQPSGSEAAVKAVAAADQQSGGRQQVQRDGANSRPQAVLVSPPSRPSAQAGGAGVSLRSAAGPLRGSLNSRALAAGLEGVPVPQAPVDDVPMQRQQLDGQPAGGRIAAEQQQQQQREEASARKAAESRREADRAAQREQLEQRSREARMRERAARRAARQAARAAQQPLPASAAPRVVAAAASGSGPASATAAAAAQQQHHAAAPITQLASPSPLQAAAPAPAAAADAAPKPAATAPDAAAASPAASPDGAAASVARPTDAPKMGVASSSDSAAARAKEDSNTTAAAAAAPQLVAPAASAGSTASAADEAGSPAAAAGEPDEAARSPVVAGPEARKPSRAKSAAKAPGSAAKASGTHTTSSPRTRLSSASAAEASPGSATGASASPSAASHPPSSSPAPSSSAQAGSSMEEPRYTPGRGYADQQRRPQGGAVSELASWASARLSSMMSRVSAPEVKLDTITVRGAEARVHVAGEEIPRRLTSVDAVLRLGSGYSSLSLDLTAQAYERDPASDKITMINPAANRHLRHVTGRAALQGMQHDAGQSSYIEDDGLPMEHALSEQEHLAGAAAASSRGSGSLLPGQRQQPPGAAAASSRSHPHMQKTTPAAPPPSKSSTAKAAGGSGGSGGGTRVPMPSTLKGLESAVQRKAADAAEKAPPAASQAHGVAAADGAASVELLHPGKARSLSQRVKGLDSEGQRPTGGRLRVSVACKRLGQEGVWPDLRIGVYGKDLHAPLVERILEIPMDISSGRLNGDLHVRCHDTATWDFPEFGGRVRCRGLGMHFWDAPDDIIDANVDLLFEGDRMYLHGARGLFGAVPIIVTGDMDLNPQTGHFRISANVPGVEFNALRATLGVRPMPFPLAGALRGVLHVTGPLEQPVFTGTAVAIPPSAGMLDDCEEGSQQALEALASVPGAVGAYDQVPFAAANAVFTLDTFSNQFVLHSATAQLAGGGQLLGSGRLLTSPEGEMDPGAVKMIMEGHGINLDWLLKRYVPKELSLPPTLVLGNGHVHGLMEGSGLEPTISARWEAPEAQAKGTLRFERQGTSGSLSSPTIDCSGVLRTKPPSFEAMRAAVTQAQALALARPNVEGCRLEAQLKGLDCLPLLSKEAKPENLGAAGAPLRLRVSGTARFNGRLTQQQQQQQEEDAATTPGPATPAAATSARAASQQQGDTAAAAPKGGNVSSSTSTSGGSGAAAAAAAGGAGSGSSFEGDLSLDGLRVNQLSLTRQLTGTLEASDRGVRISARGNRPDESLDVQLAWPLFETDTLQQQLQGSSSAAAAAASAEGDGTAAAAESEQQQQRGLNSWKLPPGFPPALANGASGTQRRQGLGLLDGWLWEDRSAMASTSSQAAASGSRELEQQQPPPAVENNSSAASGTGAEPGAGSFFKLRCGKLLMSAEVSNSTSQVEVAVQNLNLDELELASLRGDLDDASLSVNFDTRLGRGRVHVTGPRFSGLQGESLLAQLRWDRDVVRLERTVLQQKNSRYEVQGDFLLPPNLVLPGSASLALVAPPPQGGRAPFTYSSRKPFEHMFGRWRLQINVPGAHVEEILPAARLLERATGVSPQAYLQAKADFLEGVHAAQLAVQDLGEALFQADLRGMVQDALAQESDPAASSSSSSSSTGTSAAARADAKGGRGAREGGASDAAAAAKQPPARGQPGLQDVRGQFSGSIQAFGSTGGATSVEFDLKGQDWEWGSYGLDQAVANGAFHSAEGLKLEELSLRVGDANLLLRGSLLGPSQAASLLVNDFPVALLQPLFRAMPALEHAAPAAAAYGWRDSPFVGGRVRPPPLAKSQGGFGGGAFGGSGGGGGLLGKALRGPALGAASSLGMRFPDVANSALYSNSPINGLLFLRGTIGGSAAAPQGEVSLRLYDGAIGPTRLAQAQAHATIDERQVLDLSLDLQPLESRQPGHVKLTGTLPLAPQPPQYPQLQPWASGTNGDGASSGGRLRGSGGGGVNGRFRSSAQQQQQQDKGGGVSGDGSLAAAEDGMMDVQVHVRDSGMMLISTLLPDVRWQHGSASVDLRASGRLGPSQEPPRLEGSASLSKGHVTCPWLKYPLTGINAQLRLAGGRLDIDSLEARAGSKGHIKIRGALPLTPDKPGTARAFLKGMSAKAGGGVGGGTSLATDAGSGAAGGGADELKVELRALELRLRNTFTGAFDATLQMRDALLSPLVGGTLRFSRGTFYVAQPPSVGGGGAGEGGGGAAGLGGGGSGMGLGASIAGLGTAGGGSGVGGSGGSGVGGSGIGGGGQAALGKPLTMLSAGQGGGVSGLSGLEQSVEFGQLGDGGGAAGGGGGGAHGAGAGGNVGGQHGSGTIGQGQAPVNVRLRGLKVVLGPELRTVYPVVMNLGISGEVELNGPLSDPSAVKLGGVINLDGGEVNLLAAQMRLDREHPNRLVFLPEQGLDPTVDLAFRGPTVNITVQGRASNWQNNLMITNATSSGGEGAEQLDPSEAARLFEGQLARAVLEENGQLAVSRLAASLSTLMPKLETQGQLGRARWRLVSAPSIPPGLLSLDPSAEGTARVLTSLITGTEVEVQFGKSLQAAMVKKIRDSDIATQWTLNYQLNNNLRMQFNISSAPPYPRTLMFQYSTQQQAQPLGPLPPG